MEIRLESWEERAEDKLLPAQAFHYTIDPEEAEASYAAETQDRIARWAAYRDDRIAARIGVVPYRMRFSGRTVPMAGIGGVATLPEYRGQGLIRGIMERIQPDARERGCVFSALFPFNHGFYRKFGYETACPEVTYSLPPSEFPRHPGGWAKMWHPGDDFGMFTEIFNDCYSRFPLSCARTDEDMARELSAPPHSTGKFRYLLGDGDGPAAYLAYQDREEAGKRVLSVGDAAYRGRRGLQLLADFLSRFSADFPLVSIRLPQEAHPLRLAKDPYAIETRTKTAYMLRVLDPGAALAMRGAEDSFVVAVTDEFIPAWSGRWRVSGAGATPTTDSPDLALTARALSVLLAGQATPEELQTMGLADINGSEKALRRAYPLTECFITEHF